MKQFIATIILVFVCITVYAKDDSGGGGLRASAKLVNPQGQTIGKVELKQKNNKVIMEVRAGGLSPGFHGIHIHSIGLCDSSTAKPFTSSGGHFSLVANATHRNHSGDLPVLLVNDKGNVKMEFNSDRFKIADLFDADGSAIVIHANPDNYANIPTDRYTPAPDAMTLAAGDSGDRVVCGIIKAARFS